MDNKPMRMSLFEETLLSYLYSEFINNKNEKSFSAVNLLCPANYQKPNISAVSLYILFFDLYEKLNKKMEEADHNHQIINKLSRKPGSTEPLTFEKLPLFYIFRSNTEIELSFVNFRDRDERFAFIDKFFNLLEIYDEAKTLKYDIFAILCDNFVFVNDIFEGILFSNSCPWVLNNKNNIDIHKLLEKLNREAILQITPYVAKHVPVDDKDLIKAVLDRIDHNGFIVNNNIALNIEWKCIPLLRLEKVSDNYNYGKVDVGCLLFSTFTYYFHLSREYKVPNKNIVLEPIWFNKLDNGHKTAHEMLSELKRLFTITAICGGIKEKILSSHW